jgi:leucyl aminopeptidase
LAATGVYTISGSLQQQKCMAEEHTGDRTWQFSLWHFYTKQVTISLSEIKTIGFWKAGGAYQGVASVTQFVPSGEWLHSDMCQCN